MSYFIHSEPGHNHENEDVAAVQPHPHDSSTLICVLADGQGGQSGGGEAARIAVAKCLELAASYSVKQLLDVRAWYEIIAGADQAVSDDPSAGFTTLIALCVSNGVVCGASCGDSAAYAFGPKQQLILTDGQRKNPPVGSSAAFPVAFSAKLRPDWKLLLVSDGVWRYIGDDAIYDTTQNLQGHDLIAALRELQLAQNGGTLGDDFSVVLVQETQGSA